MPGEKEDNGEATGGNTGVNDEDNGGHVCVVVVLVTVQANDAQGEYTVKGKGGNVWAVIIPAQGDNLDNSEDNCEA